MSIQEIKFRFTGTRPLMMQSERTANPLDPIVKEIQKYTGKKPKDKTDADHVAVHRLEFEAAFYNGDSFGKIGPYLPGLNIEACLRDGAKSQRKGATIRRAIQVPDECAKLEYKGPRTIKQLWEEPAFVDIRGVRPTRGKVMRCRPIFPDWALTTTVLYENTMLNKQELVDIAEYAGKYIGLGTYRPTFGRFDVKVLRK